VAAKKDLVNEYTSVISESGLVPVVCDVDAFAIQNMFEANYDVPSTETVALVNVGASKTNINIVAGGFPSFTRDLTVGGNAFTEEIQKQMNLTFEEAEALKIGGKERRDTDVVIPADVDRALQAVAENLTSEVQRSIDFYSATSADSAPSEIYLSGGSARLQVLSRAIETRIKVPVHVVDPFRHVQVNPQDEAYLRAFGPTAAVSVGLALRSGGDG
jgi:type IV pilus assembly protein PilM